MNRFNYPLNIGLLLLLWTITVSSQPGNVFYSGESLTYRVSWSIFRLGTIQIEAWRDSSSEDTNLFKVTMQVTSNPDIPFINILEINETVLNVADCMSRSLYARHINNSEDLEIECIYVDDLKQAVFSVKDVETGMYKRFDILNNVPLYLDGPSLFFFARTQSQSGNVYTVPTLIDGRIQKTILDFTGPEEYIKVDAFEYPLRVRKYTGVAKWTGGTSAGLSGNFSGWICDDNTAITLKAEMEVFLGSLVIELEDYYRPDWMPTTIAESGK